MKPKPIVTAVLDSNVDAVRRCLAEGASPDEIHGHPLIIHAARLHHPVIFHLLLECGASLPDDLLGEVISWELGDWIIQSDKEEEDLLTILETIRATPAWPSLERRRELASRLNGYNLNTLVAALLDDNFHANAQSAQNA